MARLAAFDMDGTLLMPDHHLGEKTLSTLARLRERDITLTFATGRHALEMQHILGALSLDAYLITGNGTRVHSLEGELLHRDDLPADVAELVLYQQWDTRASMHIFNDDGWFTGKEIPALLQAFVYSGFRYQIIDVKKMPLGSVTKICFCGDHDDLTRLQIQLYEALGERAHLCFSATDCLEVLPVGCNKGAALTVLTQHLGLSLRDCMAFGDAMNDREMLGCVGSGFIIGKVALLDPEKIGLGLTAFVLIKTQHHSSEWYCRFVTVVTEMPEVLGFWRMAGEYDYLMRVQVADMKRYDEFYKRLVNSVPGLSDVTSSFAMEQIKYTTSLPIE